MIVACVGRVSGQEGYVSKKTGSSVSQLYVDVRKMMLQVECEDADAYPPDSLVVCVGELRSWQGNFRLKDATVRMQTAEDVAYFGGRDIPQIMTTMEMAKVMVAATSRAEVVKNPAA